MLSDSQIHHTKILIKGKIIQILPGTNDPYLGVNCLINEDQLELTRIDVETQEVTDQIKIPNTIPNFHIKYFSANYIVGTTFREDQNPDLYEVSIFKWNKEEPIYSFMGTRLLEADDDHIKILHPTIVGREICIDLVTGEEIKEGITSKSNSRHTIQHPVSYPKQNPYFEWFEKLLSKHGHKATMHCEHLKWQENQVISFYTEKGNRLTNCLIIIDSNGLELFSHRLAQNLNGIALDTFFVIENKLIFADDQNLLSILYV